MWQSVAAYFTTFLDTTFPLQRQKQLTLSVLVLIASVGVMLLLLIAWSDLFLA